MREQRIEVVLVDTDGYTSSQEECETLQQAKQRAKKMLTDEWAETATEGQHTHTDLRTRKAEVRVNGECVWDQFYRGGTK